MGIAAIATGKLPDSFRTRQISPSAFLTVLSCASTRELRIAAMPATRTPLLITRTGGSTSVSKLVIYTDGASRGNPGPAGIGIVICDETGEVVRECGAFIGIATNNVAEYQALIKALELARGFHASEVACFSDSELMVKQLNGEYTIKNPRLQELLLHVREKEKQFRTVSYQHVSREDTRIMKADQLANRALARTQRA